MPYAGFPSLFVLPIPKAELKAIKLNCFGSESRYSTLTLFLPEMDPSALPPTAELATAVLGKRCFVNWPMMHEAEIVAVSDQHAVFTRKQTADKTLSLAGVGRAKKKASAAATSGEFPCHVSQS